ncbi:hypothetical protein FOA52_011230 [Chlamydomonas sp. UWO 241]|nr:hypothetical protein FOA52_011230 [Chlamydomonas sp. UWO 241]
MSERESEDDGHGGVFEASPQAAAILAALSGIMATHIERSPAELESARVAALEGHSTLRGVTRHRRTARYEAHIWEDRRQCYLGGFDVEDHAAKAHDVMAIKCRGAAAAINFDPSLYDALTSLLADVSSASAAERRTERQAVSALAALSGGSASPRASPHTRPQHAHAPPPHERRSPEEVRSHQGVTAAVAPAAAPTGAPHAPAAAGVMRPRREFAPPRQLATDAAAVAPPPSPPELPLPQQQLQPQGLALPPGSRLLATLQAGQSGGRGQVVGAGTAGSPRQPRRAMHLAREHVGAAAGAALFGAHELAAVDAVDGAVGAAGGEGLKRARSSGSSDEAGRGGTAAAVGESGDSGEWSGAEQADKALRTRATKVPRVLTGGMRVVVAPGAGAEGAALPGERAVGHGAEAVPMEEDREEEQTETDEEGVHRWGGGDAAGMQGVAGVKRGAWGVPETTLSGAAIPSGRGRGFGRGGGRGRGSSTGGRARGSTGAAPFAGPSRGRGSRGRNRGRGRSRLTAPPPPHHAVLDLAAPVPVPSPGGGLLADDGRRSAPLSGARVLDLALPRLGGIGVGGSYMVQPCTPQQQLQQKQLERGVYGGHGYGGAWFPTSTGAAEAAQPPQLPPDSRLLAMLQSDQSGGGSGTLAFQLPLREGSPIAKQEEAAGAAVSARGMAAPGGGVIHDAAHNGGATRALDMLCDVAEAVLEEAAGGGSGNNSGSGGSGGVWQQGEGSDARRTHQALMRQVDSGRGAGDRARLLMAHGAMPLATSPDGSVHAGLPIVAIVPIAAGNNASLLEELATVQQAQQEQAARHAQQLAQLQQLHQHQQAAMVHARQMVHAQQMQAAQEAQRAAVMALMPASGAAAAPLQAGQPLVTSQAQQQTPWHTNGQVTTNGPGATQHGGSAFARAAGVAGPSDAGPSDAQAQPSQPSPTASLAVVHPHPVQLITFGPASAVPEHVRRWARQFTATTTLLGSTHALPPVLLMQGSGGGNAAPASAPTNGTGGAWTLSPCLALVPPRDG